MASKATPPNFEIDLWRGRFAQRDIEASFQSELIRGQWRVFAAVAALIFSIDTASFSIDAWRQNSELRDILLVSVRLVAMAASALFIWVSWRHNQKQLYVWAAEAYVMLVVTVMLTTLFLHGDYGFIAPLTLICVIYALYLLAPFSWGRQIVYTLTFTAFGCWALLINGDSHADFARLAQWLVFAHASGALVSWQRHINQRRLHAQRINLERINALETQERIHHQALVDLITHELRNPLASIYSQAELVQRIGDAASRRHAREIVDASVRIRKMLRVWVEGDRLATAGRMEMQPQSIEIDADLLLQLTMQVIERAQELYSQLDIALDQRFGLKAVQVDARTYALVLLNLLDNAAKYGARADSEAVRVTVSMRHARGRLWVRVRDWGRGIAYDHQEAVFEKHQRLHTQGVWRDSGTGVGLHLCRTLLSLHDGNLWLRSTPRAGTAFVIDLQAK